MGCAERWPPRTMWLFMTQPSRCGVRLRSTRFLKSIIAENTAVFDIWPDVTRVSTCDAPRNFFISSTSIASTEAIKPVP